MRPKSIFKKFLDRVDGIKSDGLRKYGESFFTIWPPGSNLFIRELKYDLAKFHLSSLVDNYWNGWSGLTFQKSQWRNY
jgi:hypothetical protein